MILGKLFLFLIVVSFLNLSVSIPIYFNELELPTGDDDVFNDRNVLDLSKLSDEELLNLEQALQDKIEEYEAIQGFVEDTVPLKNYQRERRGGGKQLIPIINDENVIDLVPIIDDEQPILIIQTPNDDDEKFVLVPEPGDEPLLPEQISSDGNLRPVIITADELDELELRQRISQLGDQLKERALRGMI